MEIRGRIAINASSFPKKYFKEILIVAFVLLFFLLTVSAVIIGVIFPSSNNLATIESYKKVAQEVGISWVELLALDTVKNENDLKNSTYSSIMNVALDFCYLELNKYQQDNAGNWNLISANSYSGTAISSFISSIGYKNEGKFQNIKDAVNGINTSEEYDAILHFKSFEEVTESLSSDKKEWVVGIVASGGIQQLYGINGFEEIFLGEIHYPEGGAKIPHFLQGNWSNVSYGSSGTIASSGCGPTALAMVVVGLTGRMDVSPATVGNWSVENGYRALEGSSWSLMTEGGKHFGLQVESLARKNPSRIVAELSKGHPVIASMQKGHFTQSGHFIVLRGVTRDGKILVNDSNSSENTNTTWDLSIIMNESSTLGGVDGSPFWAYSK